MTERTPIDPGFAARCRASFARQDYMTFVGARMAEVAPGYCEIRLPFRPELTQQHGYFHGGVVGAIVDSAAGYAAYSLMPADSSVLTVEYKLNLMAPAEGAELIARGRVKRAGRTITVVEGWVAAVGDRGEKPVAQMLGTFLCLAG